MQVLSLRQVALLAAATAALAARTDAASVTASTTVSASSGVSGTVSAATSTGSTSTSASVSTTTTTGSSSSSLDNTAGSVSCVFRYSMPTASNVPSEVAAAGSSNTAGASGSDASNSYSGYSSYSGSDSDLDGSDQSAGTVSLPSSDSTSDSSDASASSSEDGDSDSSKASSASSKASSSSSGSSTSTTAPTSTTKTPTTTTATPTSTTATPSSTTKTPSTSTSTTTGSSDTSRRLVGEEAELSVSAGSISVDVDLSGSSSSSSTSTSTTPTSTTKTPSSTTASPSSTTATSSSTSSSSLSSSSSATYDASSSSTSTTGSAGSTTIEFSCDSTFYGAWSQMGLTCGGTELDVDSAAAASECLIYSGLSSGTEITDMTTCMSVCRFPACNNGTWDYSADDGLGSDVYANLDFLTLMSYAGTEASSAVLDAVTQPFSNLTFTPESECEYTSDSSFSSCDCDNLLVSSTTSSSGTGTSGTSGTSEYSVPEDKGLEDSDHWADGTTKTTVDKAGIASTTIGSSAATVSVVAGGVMSVASGVVGGTSAGVASGVSAAASVGITMAAVDICQFSIMINQMNVDARPRFLENMGKRMAPAAFSFLPFGKTTDDDSDSSSSGSGSSSTSASSSGSSTRRLADGSSTSGSTSSSSGSSSSSTSSSVQGMEKYAKLIGVQADKLFYLAVAGVGCVVACLFLAYGLAMLVCYFIVSDFPSFARKWFDKAIGVLMMILILSEYVIGGTATYQICYCIDHDVVDVSLFAAIAALLVLAVGTILYGVMIIRNNEDELRDLGTKDHFEKKFHARYGPLYDEHSFEGRFFFAPKLMLALLCGVTTGMIWIEGLWQIVVLIALHIAFLLYLEIKQPYPTAFVQKTSSFVIIIKISALFLSFFLLSSATSFTESIPDDLREGVGFAIVGLQVLVLVCLMIRQIYIFYRTWKLKRDGGAEEEKTNTVQTANARDGSEAFFALGGEPQYNSQQRGNSLAVLGDTTPRLQDPNQYSQQTPTNAGYGKLRGLQPTGGSGMTRTQSVVTHEQQQQYQHQSQQQQYQHQSQQHPGVSRNNEVDL